jgi:hypothetical protein
MKVVSRKGAGGAKEERQAVGSFNSLRAFLCATSAFARDYSCPKIDIRPE